MLIVPADRELELLGDRFLLALDRLCFLVSLRSDLTSATATVLSPHPPGATHRSGRPAGRAVVLLLILRILVLLLGLLLALLFFRGAAGARGAG